MKDGVHNLWQKEERNSTAQHISSQLHTRESRVSDLQTFQSGAKPAGTSQVSCLLGKLTCWRAATPGYHAICHSGKKNCKTCWSCGSRNHEAGEKFRSCAGSSKSLILSAACSQTKGIEDNTLQSQGMVKRSFHEGAKTLSGSKCFFWPSVHINVSSVALLLWSSHTNRQPRNWNKLLILSIFPDLIISWIHETFLGFMKPEKLHLQMGRKFPNRSIHLKDSKQASDAISY